MPVEPGNMKLNQPECCHAREPLSSAPYFVLLRHGVFLGCESPELACLLILPAICV